MKKVYLLSLIAILAGISVSGNTRNQVSNLKLFPSKLLVINTKNDLITLHDSKDLKAMLDFNHDLIKKIVESKLDLSTFDFRDKNIVASFLGVPVLYYEKQLQTVKEAAVNFRNANKDFFNTKNPSAECSSCSTNFPEKLKEAEKIIFDLRKDKIRFNKYLIESSSDKLISENQSLTDEVNCCGCSALYYVCLTACLTEPELYFWCGIYCIDEFCDSSCCITPN